MNASNDPTLEQVSKLIGIPRSWACEVTSRDIRRFAQAIGATDRVHYDDDYARRTVHGGIVAPPLFCQTLTYEDVPPTDLLPDGSPKEIDIPIPARRTVGGGSQYTVHRLVRAGETIKVTSMLKDVTVKNGKSGVLYLVSVQTTFTDQNDEPVAVEVATYVKRV